jgi:hypothetical protein
VLVAISASAVANAYRAGGAGAPRVSRVLHTDWAATALTIVNSGNLWI